MTQIAPQAPDTFDWVDALSPTELLEELAGAGVNVGAVEGAEPHSVELPVGPPYQLVPLGDAWLRIEFDDEGRMVAHFVDDARKPLEDNGTPPVVFSDESEDLNGWMMARADIDASGRRWVSVLRRPEREAYVAIVYDATVGAPERRLLVAGVYPDVLLLDHGRLVAFVEPLREPRGGQRAVIATARNDVYEESRRVIASSPSGGLGVRACSVGRFFKLSRGVRSQRVWDIVDARSNSPQPRPVPGNPRDPALFDVALLAGEAVIIHAVNTERSWMLRVTRIEDGSLLQTWTAASGLGTVKEVTSGSDCAVLRVSLDGEESIHKFAIAGFSSRDDVLHRSPGLLDLTGNRTTPAVGFVATEMTGGMEPFDWRWDNRGVPLNELAELRAVRRSRIRSQRVTIASADGYEFEMDMKWLDEGNGPDRPVLLMVYGAYGVDIDLDTDSQLGEWLDRGFAVVAPHTRGGGPDLRHRAGTRAKRQNSLNDAAAAVDYLKSGAGPITATRIAVIGASAGGFLSAATMNLRPRDIDAVIIVNGFVDPLTSLLAGDTITQSSDKDEWGDPANNPKDLEVLHAISPVENLRAATAKALVVVAACDVRVNPRQGLKWTLKYRALGGEVDLWFDPQGAHDCWGQGMSPSAIMDWVCDALGVSY